MILFRNWHVSLLEPADSSTDFRLLPRTTNRLRQLGHAILEPAAELEAST